MTSLVTRESQLIRVGDLVFWEEAERRVEAVEKDSDIAGYLVLRFEGGGKALIPEVIIPSILVSRYEDRINDSVAELRLKECTLLAQVKILEAISPTSVIEISELKRGLRIISDSLQRKGARKAFESNANTIDI